jgi:hypothetical protein
VLCGGNAHVQRAVEVTSPRPYSGRLGDAAKNVVDLDRFNWFFHSECRRKELDIPHTRKNWLCHELKHRKIVQKTT